MRATKGQRDLKKELRDRSFQFSQQMLEKKNYIESWEDFSNMLRARSI